MSFWFIGEIGLRNTKYKLDDEDYKLKVNLE